MSVIISSENDGLRKSGCRSTCDSNNCTWAFPLNNPHTLVCGRVCYAYMPCHHKILKSHIPEDWVCDYVIAVIPSSRTFLGKMDFFRNCKGMVVKNPVATSSMVWCHSPFWAKMLYTLPHLQMSPSKKM